jgi:hypothetical protein
MPNFDALWPGDDRDMLVSDLFTGRWTVAARLAHRDTGARRVECPTCFGGGIVPTLDVFGRDAVTDTEMTVGDLFAGRWSSQARRTHRAIEATFLDCLTCHGRGVVAATVVPTGWVSSQPTRADDDTDPATP